MSPAISTKVFTLFMRSSHASARVGRHKKSETPSAPRLRVDEGLALMRGRSCLPLPRLDRARTLADSLDDPGVRLVADELLPFYKAQE